MQTHPLHSKLSHLFIKTRTNHVFFTILFNLLSIINTRSFIKFINIMIWSLRWSIYDSFNKWFTVIIFPINKIFPPTFWFMSLRWRWKWNVIEARKTKITFLLRRKCPLTRNYVKRFVINERVEKCSKYTWDVCIANKQTNIETS